MTKTASGIVLPTFPERYITTKSGKTKKVEYKIILGELKAVNDDQGTVEGYLNVVGNIDYGNDRTKSGAFKRTIDLSYKRKAANNYEYLWPYLWNHSTDLIPPGGIFDAEEDKKGLFIKARLNLDTQLGREMYSSYKFGSLNKQSMGYLAHKTEWVREGDENVRELIEVEILEGSGVIFPMNDLADVTTVKSMFSGLGGVIEGEKGASDKKSGRHMDRKGKEKKTVQEHYAEEMCKDLMCDWADVFLKVVTQSVLDALKIGDQPEQDISQALDDFKELVLTKFVPEAIECDLSGYISDNSDTYSSADYVMQYGSGGKPSYYGYMSNDPRRDQKIGKPISADNQKTIDAHVKDLKSKAKSVKADMQGHTDNMHDAADSIRDIASGNNAKAGRAISSGTAQALNNLASSVDDHADKAMDTMKEHAKAVRTAADDLATRMQGAETPYAGDDPGTPDDGQQEGKSDDHVTPPQKARDTQERPSEEGTVNERDLELALAFVQGIKTAS